MFTFVSGRISVSGKESGKMAEHINRDTFLEQERAWYCNNCDRRKNSKGKTVYEIGEAPCRACDIGTMLDAVEDYPAADVVVRKTGKWVKISPAGIYECNQCGQNVMTSDIEAYKFCHGCGAQMSGGDDDV